MSTIVAKISAELRGDRSIWAVLAILAVFSLLVVYSSTGTLAYRERGGNTEAYLVKHLMIVSGGIFLTYICHQLHYMVYHRAAPVFSAKGK